MEYKNKDKTEEIKDETMGQSLRKGYQAMWAVLSAFLGPFVGFFIGYYLDKLLHTHKLYIFTFIFTIGGFIYLFREVYRLLKKTLDD